MNLPIMTSLRRTVLVAAAALCLFALAGCGSSSEVSAVAAAGEAEQVADAAEAEAAAEAEDHDDEDHDDEHAEHDDEHKDHDDDDHDDEHDDHDDEHKDDDDHDDHDDEVSGGFDAHVHGIADLFVAWTGGDVVVDLISPADNIFGFEYEPTTDEDIAVAADRTEALEQPGVIAFNDEAGCSLVDVDAIFEIDGSHAEVATSWMFACDNPDEINELDVSELFEEFPRLADIDAQWASDDAQSAAELSASSSVLKFN